MNTNDKHEKENRSQDTVDQLLTTLQAVNQHVEEKNLIIQSQQKYIRELERQIQLESVMPGRDNRPRSCPADSSPRKPLISIPIIVQTQVCKHLYFSSGVQYWEIHIHEMLDQGLTVGIAPRGFASRSCFSTQSNVRRAPKDPRCCWYPRGAIGYSAQGYITTDGGQRVTEAAYHAGDVIGIQLDMNHRTIRFDVNGTRRSSDLSIGPSTQAVFAAVSCNPETDKYTVLS